MKRSRLIAGVTLIQLLVGLAWLGMSILLLFLIRSMRHVQDAPAAGIWGLKVGIGLMAPLALLALVGAYGMYKDRQWGWWLSFLIDLGFASSLAYAVIDDGWSNRDLELIVPTVLFAIPVVFLLLPRVRRFYRVSSHQPLEPPAVEPPLGQST